MEKFETILTNCINEIKSGKVTLADCLDRYPALRNELEPLLKLALNIQAPQGIKLDNQDKQAARARLLQQIKTPKEKKARSFLDIFSLGIPRSLAPARIAVSAVVIVIIMSLLAGGTAYASQDSLPGDLLYPVKIASEDARLFIAGDNAAKAELNLRFAQTRLEEMGKLASGDGEEIESAVNGYRKHLNAAMAQAGNITDNSSLSVLLGKALADIQDQILYCDHIMDSNPANAEMVRAASSLSNETQAEFLKMLGKHDIVQAAQANLNAMANRLERAHAKANENCYREMQDALLQYQELNGVGEDILQNAQDSRNHDTEVADLSLQSLTGYQDTLEAISQEVPEEYQNAVEESREKTEHFREKAHNQDQHQNNNDSGSQSDTPESNVKPDTGENGQPDHNSGAGNGNSNNVPPEITSTTAPPPTTTEQGHGNGNSNDIGNGQGTGNIPDNPETTPETEQENPNQPGNNNGNGHNNGR